MTKSRTLVACGLVVLLYLLHNDFWFWNDPQLILGLPVGLLYHVIYCLVSAIVLLILIYGTWTAGWED